MKYLKKYNVFESYSIEEFIGELTNKLGLYNLTPVQIRELVNRLNIDDYINNGITPKEVVDELDKDMEFSSGGYPNCYLNTTKQTTIKYL